MHELGELLPLGRDHHGHRDEERKHLRHGELIGHVANAHLERLVVHQLLVLRALEGGERVAEHAEDEGSLVELQAVCTGLWALLEARERHAAHDAEEARDLGERQRLLVENRVDERGEHRLARLDNLAKERVGTEAEDARRVRRRAAEAHRDHRHQICPRRLGQLHPVRKLKATQFDRVHADEPHQQRVNRADAELHRRHRHCQTPLLAARTIQCHFVVLVVVNVTDVPEDKEEEKCD